MTRRFTRAILAATTVLALNTFPWAAAPAAAELAPAG